jgi:TetR/AcrR family transcriptional repressor of nem operon
MGKGNETRNRIIEEAAALFNQRGYEGASMTELMEATGLEKGGLYRHFDSKEEIAAEAFDYAWTTVFESRMKDLDLIDNRVDRLKKFVSNFVEGIPSLPGGCPLLNTAVDADDGNPVLRERVRKALTTLHAQVTKIIQEGIRGGDIRPAVDAKSVATLVISSLEGALMISRLNRDRGALRTVQAHLDDYFERQVRAPKRSR